MFNGKFSGKLEVEKNNQTKFFILASKNRVKDVANVSLINGCFYEKEQVCKDQEVKVNRQNKRIKFYTFADNYLLS